MSDTTVASEPGLLKVAVPLRVPTAVGENVIDTAQLLNAGIVPPHASTAAKSPAMSVPSAAGTAWWFVNSTCCGPLVVSTRWDANVNDVTEAVTPLMPLPLSATAFGDSVVSLVMTSDPVRGPAIVGVIVSEITQLCVAANVGPHVVPTTSTAKSPPTDSDMLLTGTLWLFRTVTCCGVLASPTFVLLNETLAGVIVRGVVPMPDSAARCGLPKALVLTPIVAGLAPPMEGVNVTETLQLAPPANVVPHVVEATE